MNMRWGDNMDISIISIGTIILSEILKYYNSNILYKNLADLGLKINMDRFNKDFSDYDESNYDFTSLVPFANVFKQFLDRYNYIQDFNLILTELNKKGYLEKMTESELEYYNKFRNMLRAKIITFDSNYVDNINLIKENKKYETIIKYYYYDIDENVISIVIKGKKYKIIYSDGPIALKSKREQKEKINDLFYEVIVYLLKMNNDKNLYEVLNNISFEDIEDAINSEDEKIRIVRVLKKDLRKMR